MTTQAWCRLENLCSFNRTSAVENVYICAKLNLFIFLLKGQNKKVSLQSSQLYSFPACPMVIWPASLISSIYILHLSLSQLIYRKLVSQLNHSVFTTSSPQVYSNDISAH